MRFTPNDPPRAFAVGFEGQVILKDCGRMDLAADEQITFVTAAGGEYDVTRKNWGFYATPSTNGRLARFGLRTTLVKNRVGQVFVLLMEKGQEAAFSAYIASERLKILAWLDDAADLARLEAGLAATGTV